MKYSKEQLIQMVKPYFKDEKVNVLYVTEDNQVFYPSGKVAAASHARVYKLQPPFEIRRSDLKVEKPKDEKIPQIEKVTTEEESDKETVIKIAIEAGIKVDKRMSVATIEKLIKEKEDGRE